MMSEQSVQLQIGDLVGAVQVIDIATQRGAFRGEELSQIGGVRDRIAAFIKANEQQPAEQPAAEESGDADAE